jgi:uncharacterized protein YdaU (DUF1376 family)
VSERPFMQLYVSDFVGDTLHLSSEQVGVYLLLLMAMWNADGSLPDDDTKLARVARVSLKKWRAMKPEMIEFFTVSEGQISHGRLTRELQKSERQTQSRAAAGAKGGTANALKYQRRGPANAIAGLKHLPEPYRKKGANASDPTEGEAQADGSVRLHSEDPIFRKIVELRGNKHPPTDRSGYWSFPADIVAQARKELAH